TSNSSTNNTIVPEDAWLNIVADTSGDCARSNLRASDTSSLRYESADSSHTSPQDNKWIPFHIPDDYFSFLPWKHIKYGLNKDVIIPTQGSLNIKLPSEVQVIVNKPLLEQKCLNITAQNADQLTLQNTSTTPRNLHKNSTVAYKFT